MNNQEHQNTAPIINTRLMNPIYTKALEIKIPPNFHISSSCPSLARCPNASASNCSNGTQDDLLNRVDSARKRNKVSNAEMFAHPIRSTYVDEEFLQKILVEHPWSYTDIKASEGGGANGA